MRYPFIIIVLFSILGIIGCSSDEGGYTRISWNFADGRTCVTGSVVEILVRGDSVATTSFQCAAGLAPESSVEILLEALPTSIILEGRTITHALFYQGRESLDTLAETEVTLRFVGGQP